MLAHCNANLTFDTPISHSHFAVTHKPWVWKVLCAVSSDFYWGGSSFVWKHQVTHLSSMCFLLSFSLCFSFPSSTYFPSLLHFFLNCDYVHTFQCHFLLSMLLATISTLTLIGLILILSQQQQLVLSHSYSDTYTTSFCFVSIYLCVYLYSCSACLSFYTSGLLTFDQLLTLLCLLARVYIIILLLSRSIVTGPRARRRMMTVYFLHRQSILHTAITIDVSTQRA